MTIDLVRISIPEAAQVLGVPQARLNRAFMRGQLYYIYLGRQRLVRTTVKWARECLRNQA